MNSPTPEETAARGNIFRDNSLPGGSIKPPEPSGWQCDLHGMWAGENGFLAITPPKGHVPNWFWRTMQYLLLGNRWRRVK